MKIRLKNEFFNLKDDWQSKFNFYIWLNIMQSILIVITIINNGFKKVGIIYTIIMFFLLGLPKIAYHFYKKEKRKEMKEKLKKELEDYKNGKNDEENK